MTYLSPSQVVNARHHDTASILSTLASLVSRRDAPPEGHAEEFSRALVALLRASEDKSQANLRRLCSEWLDDGLTDLRPGILDDGDDAAVAAGLLTILKHRAWYHSLPVVTVKLVNGIPSDACPACGQGVNLVGDARECHTCGAALRWPYIPCGIPEESAPERAIREWLEELANLAAAEADREVLRHVNHRRAAVAARIAADEPSPSPKLARGVLDSWLDARTSKLRPNVLSDPGARSRARRLLDELRPVAAPRPSDEVSEP